jgi:hypothetical protein
MKAQRFSQAWSWRVEYDDALRENDRVRLFTRIEVAQAAILLRRDAISQDGAHPDESRAIARALAHLHILKRDRLGYKGPTNGDQPPGRRAAN